MDWNNHDIGEWMSSIALTTIGYFTRLVFGEDKLTKGQLVLFYAFCIGVTWITNRYIEAGVIRSSIQLVAGLVVINLIKGIIRGAKGSEGSVSDKVKNKINDILK